MGIVDVANLKKSYGEIVAVDDISFSIEKGEIFGFLGPNGAGKTSTINMMIGLSRPTSGQIIIDGIDAIKNIKKVQRIIGIVPDENNLYDEMNGFDNLCFWNTIIICAEKLCDGILKSNCSQCGPVLVQNQYLSLR